MDIKWLWFDLDNTLLDFSMASKLAMWQTFEDFDRICTDDIYKIYSKINLSVWQAFERGEISAEELRVKRFRDLLEALEDDALSPEEMSRGYLRNVVVKSQAYEDIFGILDRLKDRYSLSVVTNGLREAQRPRIEKLNMTHYFDSIVVSDEIGVAKPDVRFFENVYTSIDHDFGKENILMIGDSLQSDIKGGNDFGVRTCWIHHEAEHNTSEVKPDYKVKNMNGFLDLMRDIEAQ